MEKEFAQITKQKGIQRLKIPFKFFLRQRDLLIRIKKCMTLGNLTLKLVQDDEGLRSIKYGALPFGRVVFLIRDCRKVTQKDGVSYGDRLPDSKPTPMR